MTAFLWTVAALFTLAAATSLWRLGTASFPETIKRTAGTYAVALPIEVGMVLWAVWLLIGRLA